MSARRYRRDPLDVTREALASGAFAWPDEAAFRDRLVIPRLHAAGWRVTVTHDSRREHWAADSGWPDVFAVRDGRALALELKHGTNQPTDEQRAWLRDLERVSGIEAAVIRATPDVLGFEELIRMRQLTWLRWRPISRPPRRPMVACADCHRSAVNEDRSLNGWQESAGVPRRYRCPGCAENGDTA